jgi:hypothetical protein
VYRRIKAGMITPLVQNMRPVTDVKETNRPVTYVKQSNRPVTYVMHCVEPMHTSICRVRSFAAAAIQAVCAHMNESILHTCLHLHVTHMPVCIFW